MKFTLCSLAMLTSVLLLQGCDNLISGADKDQSPLNPSPGTEDLSARPRPSDSVETLKISGSTVLGSSGQEILMRGIKLDLGSDVTVERIGAIELISDTGSNVVRLIINEDTTDPELEAAMVKVMEQGLVAIVTLDSDRLRCSSNGATLNSLVDSHWLKKWLGVIAQDRFQPHLIINIANAWGPEEIFNAESYGYQDYLNTYKAMVNKFRSAGFKVPIAIDAPCGEDFNAFSRGRGRELLAADTAKNIIISVDANGAKWNTSARTTLAIANLMETGLPFVLGSFKGSGVDGLGGVDHQDLMQKGAGNPSLMLNIPWESEADTAAYVASFPEPIPLLDGAGVSTQVYLDARYLELKPISDADGKLVPKGTLTTSMFVKDESGNALRVGSVEAKDLRGYQWNNVAFTLPLNNEEIDANNLLNGATEFDLSSVAQVGIEFLANGKAASVAAAISLDDLEVYPGAPAPTLASATKAASDTAWFNAGWGGTTAPVIEDGLMKISLEDGSWGAVIQSPGWQSQEVLPLINFNQNVFVDFEVFVPSAYQGQGLGLKVFGNFGDSWDINTETMASVSGGIQYDEWNTFRATLKWSETADVSIPQNIGFQVTGISPSTESLLFDDITITQQAGKRTKTVTALQYESRFSKSTETFDAAWGRQADVQMVDGELHIVPAWTPLLDDQGNPVIEDGNEIRDVVVLKADINSITDIDVSGAVIYKVKIFIPESYAGSDLEFRIFTQDNNWGNDKDFPDRPLTIDDFTPGAWTEFEFETDDFPEGFARSLALRHFGFRWSGQDLIGNTDTVKIDDIQLFGNTEVEDSQPLYSNGFDTPELVAAVTFESAAGGLSESALAGAKQISWKIAPFGWIAHSWFGNTGEEEVLNISTSEDALNLTERGEEIVNGEFGIRATVK